MYSRKILSAAALAALSIGATSAFADDNRACSDPALPKYDDLRAALQAVIGNNGGLELEMWATVVDRTGVVCQVVRSGNAGEQWPGSRVISAQKANTANAFSLPKNGSATFPQGLALSTANLFSAVQPGGSLFGLQESNPVDVRAGYLGPAQLWGTKNDPMRGFRIGGVNVFGGGLALYDSKGKLVGGLGVSGDTSCADHNIAWRVRDTLKLDNVPAGVGTPGDNIVYDIDPTTGKSAGGFGHPVCSDASKTQAQDFKNTAPLGSN